MKFLLFTAAGLGIGAGVINEETEIAKTVASSLSEDSSYITE